MAITPTAPVTKDNRPSLTRHLARQVTYKVIYRAPSTLNRWLHLTENVTFEQAEAAIQDDMNDIFMAVTERQTLSAADEYPRDYYLLEVVEERKVASRHWTEVPGVTHNL